MLSSVWLWVVHLLQGLMTSPGKVDITMSVAAVCPLDIKHFATRTGRSPVKLKRNRNGFSVV